MDDNGDPDLEPVRAMLAQALAEARARGAERIAALHLTMYDRSPEALDALREALKVLTPGTPAENAELCTRPAPSQFICWNCCGLRFEADTEEAICPNCGSEGLIVPSDITFALERVVTAE
jgi:Zn finger protein HypA/HybF involved in hydrogenase expression